MAETYWKKALEKGADKTKIEERMKRPKVEKPTPKADKKE